MRALRSHGYEPHAGSDRGARRLGPGRRGHARRAAHRHAAVGKEPQLILHDSGQPDYSSFDSRNLALELVRVTESAALRAARYYGRGDKNGADQAAVDGMRAVLKNVRMNGTIVIGEGEKDEAPMLYNGERVGDGTSLEVDVAVDPLDGTTLCANGAPNAVTVIAVAEKGAMLDPGPCVYMVSPLREHKNFQCSYFTNRT